MASSLASLVHHIALPPDLPGKAENDLFKIEKTLIEGLTAAVRTVRNIAPTDGSQEWESLRRILQTCRDLNAEDRLNRDFLLAEFRELTPGHMLIVHVREQNAGFLVYRQTR